MSFFKKFPVILAATMVSFSLLAPVRAATISLLTPQTPLTVVTGTTTFDLDEIFTLVRFTCDFGTGTGTLTGTQAIDVQLFPLDTPATTKNFLTYAENGLYRNTFIHRSATGFVVQGGGFLQYSTTASWALTSSGSYTNLGAVVQDWPVINEPKISNTRGTIAMAKLGNDPNSATNQWFFSLADNSANLDQQNGGFTVFGNVLGTGMDVVDKIAAIPTLNAGSVLNSLPVLEHVSDTAPGRLVLFPSIGRLSVSSYAVAPLGQPAGSTNIVATVVGKTLNLRSSGTGTSTSGTVKISATIGSNVYQMDIPFNVVISAPTPVLPLRFFRDQSVQLYPGDSTTLDLSKFFSIVRFNSFKWGSFDLQLYTDPTPNAAQNFLKYVDAKYYDGTIFDRFTTTPSLAWGGYLKSSTPTGTGTLSYTSTFSQIADDTGFMPLNTRGTIFFYKNDANTAQNIWLLNLGYNANQIGGYATFGEVLGNGMTDVIDKMALIPTGTWTNNIYNYNPSVIVPGFSSIEKISMTSYIGVPPTDHSFTLTTSSSMVTLVASSTATVGTTIQINNNAGGKTYRLNLPVSILSMVAKDAAKATQTGTSTYNLSVTGQYAGGEQNLTYTWDTGGSSAVTITPNGTNAAKNAVATFTKAGNYTLRVTAKNPAGGISTSNEVNVTISQTATSIDVSPTTAVLELGGTQTFTAIAKDQYGDPMTSQPSSWKWSCNGSGTIIESTGVYTAGSESEAAIVIVSSSSTGDITATAKVFVAHLTTVPLQLERGWNLISMPVEPTAQTLTALFGAALPRGVWRWDATQKRFFQATYLHAFDACWLYAPAAANLSLTGAGVPSANPVISLKAGWNMIGILNTNVPAANCYGWKAGRYGHFFIDATPQPARGYWIFMAQDAVYNLETGN